MALLRTDVLQDDMTWEVHDLPYEINRKDSSHINIAIDTSSVGEIPVFFNNISHYFDECSKLKFVDFADTEVVHENSNFADSSYAFNGCENLVSYPISNLEGVTNASHMYSNAFKTLTTTLDPLEHPVAKDTSYMYHNVDKIVGTAICNENVVNASHMYDSTKIEYSACGENVKDASYMYYNTLVTDINVGTNVSNARNMYGNCVYVEDDVQTSIKLLDGSYMYDNCCNATGEPLCSTIATNTAFMYNNCGNLTGNSCDQGASTNTAFMFAGCVNLTGDPIRYTNISSVSTNTAGMFSNCYNLKEKVNASTASLNESCMYENCGNVNGVPAVSDVAINQYRMYYNCSKLGSLARVSSVATNQAEMYYNCQNIMAGMIGSSATNTMGMYNNCIKLLGTMQTVTYSKNTRDMFHNCYNLAATVLVAPASANCENMYRNCYNITEPKMPMSVDCYCKSMYENCYSLTGEVDFTYPITENVSNMFYNCNGELNITVKTFGDGTTLYNTGNLHNIFGDAQRPTADSSVYSLGKYDNGLYYHQHEYSQGGNIRWTDGTDHIDVNFKDKIQGTLDWTDAHSVSMHVICSTRLLNNVLTANLKLGGESRLENVNGWECNVTSGKFEIMEADKYYDPTNMFNGGSHLSSIDFEDGILENMSGNCYSMYRECSNITGWFQDYYPPIIRNGQYMFYNCQKLCTGAYCVYPPSLEIENAHHMFDGCTSIETGMQYADAQKTYPKLKDTSYMFANTMMYKYPPILTATGGVNCSHMFDGAGHPMVASSMPSDFVKDSAANCAYMYSNFKSPLYGSSTVLFGRNCSHMYDNTTHADFAPTIKSTVTDLSYAFANTRITSYSLPVKYVDIPSSVTNVRNMFRGSDFDKGIVTFGGLVPGGIRPYGSVYRAGSKTTLSKTSYDNVLSGTGTGQVIVVPFGGYDPLPSDVDGIIPRSGYRAVSEAAMSRDGIILAYDRDSYYEETIFLSGLNAMMNKYFPSARDTSDAVVKWFNTGLYWGRTFRLYVYSAYTTSTVWGKSLVATDWRVVTTHIGFNT